MVLPKHYRCEPGLFESDEILVIIDGVEQQDRGVIQIKYTLKKSCTAQHAWFGAFPHGSAIDEVNEECQDIYKILLEQEMSTYLTFNAYGISGKWQLCFFRDDYELFAFVDFNVTCATTLDVQMSIDKHHYNTGDTIVIQTTFEDSLLDTAWIGIFQKSCSSAHYRDGLWIGIGKNAQKHAVGYSEIFRLALNNNNATGPHEVRFFPTQAFQPSLVVPFYVQSENGIRLLCDYRVLDGREIFINYDARKIFSSHAEWEIGQLYALCFTAVPRNQKCSPKDEQHQVQSYYGCTSFVVNSGTFPTGEWEIRVSLNEYPEMPLAVCEFILVGVDEMFFEKLRKDPKTDLDIICF